MSKQRLKITPCLGHTVLCRNCTCKKWPGFALWNEIILQSGIFSHSPTTTTSSSTHRVTVNTLTLAVRTWGDKNAGIIKESGRTARLTGGQILAVDLKSICGWLCYQSAQASTRWAEAPASYHATGGTHAITFTQPKTNRTFSISWQLIFSLDCNLSDFKKTTTTKNLFRKTCSSWNP